MNDENPAKQMDSSEVSEEQKGQLDNKASTPKPDEVKKLELQESFKKIHDRSDKFSHEWDLKREAENLDMKVEEYRHWYELSSKPPTWRSRFWQWTGFGEKKLWDVLQLIIVPVILAGGAYYLQDTAKQREQVQQDAAKKREQEAAMEKANQDTLTKYLDQMAELLKKGLLKTKINPETFIIAQAKTVIALQALDPKRQHLVIQFLDASNLNTLDGKKGILYQARMSKANLKEADLSSADLSSTDLGLAKLNKADLSLAKLNKAKLSGADLSGAKLNKADLSLAKLNKAKLSGADLSGAKLREADLSDADLSEANLIEVKNLTKKQQDQAKLCKTALPDGKVSNRDCEKLKKEEDQQN